MQASLKLRHYIPENLAESQCPDLNRKATESIEGIHPSLSIR